MTPTDVGELVDEGFFEVVLGGERGAHALEVAEEGGFVFDGEDDVDGGGEAVGEAVGAGFGLPFRGDGALRFGSVDAGLLGAGEFGGGGVVGGHVCLDPFDNEDRTARRVNPHLRFGMWLRRREK